jgi:hypothetical protein
MWRHDPALEHLYSASPSETTPALLELARAQAARRGPAELAQQRARDRFVQPSVFDLRALHRLDGLALDAAAEFEAIQLSPVAPLGVCSSVAPTSQDRVLSTMRGSEVVSDPTNVMALEIARRLRAAPETVVRLCTCHQVLRAQKFAMAEAGPSRPEDGFEVEAIARHVGVLDAIFDAVTRRVGASLPDRRLQLFSSPRRAVAAARVEARLRAAFPHVTLVSEPFESAYYDGLRVLFGARTADGEHLPIADVGVFDWMAKLTSNRRLRLVATGIGLQLILARFVGGPSHGP